MKAITVLAAIALSMSACGGNSSSIGDVSKAMHAKTVTTAAAFVHAGVNGENACADTEQLTKTGDPSKKGRFVCVLFPGERIVYGDSPDDFS